MNYTLTIKRGTENQYDEITDPITERQWLGAIKNNPNFEFDIGLERSDYSYAEITNNDDETWLHLEENGTLSTENPTPLFIFHMLKLAAEINALVIGEECEVYDLCEQGFRSRLAYAEGDRFCYWCRIDTDNGINFISEVNSNSS